MKTLTLLRHAKSGWDDPVARDFDRPLNPKGQRAAQTMGQHMRTLGLEFDHVLASPAVRVTETLEAVEAGYGTGLAPAWDKRIYLASSAMLLDLVRELPDALGRVLLVGHNPGLEDLALYLVPDDGGPSRDEASLARSGSAHAGSMNAPGRTRGEDRLAVQGRGAGDRDPGQACQRERQDLCARRPRLHHPGEESCSDR